MEKRLLEIIAKGGGQVKDLIEAEKELGIWRTRIEELEGEVRYYNNLVGLATLTIHLTEKDIRSAYAVVENRKVDLGIEVEDVEAAQRKAQELVAQAKGRVTRSELRKGESGSFQAILHFEATPGRRRPAARRPEADRQRHPPGDGPVAADRGRRRNGRSTPRSPGPTCSSRCRSSTWPRWRPSRPSTSAWPSPTSRRPTSRCWRGPRRRPSACWPATWTSRGPTRPPPAWSSRSRRADADGILALIKQAGEVMRLQEVETQGDGPRHQGQARLQDRLLRPGLGQAARVSSP